MFAVKNTNIDGAEYPDLMLKIATAFAHADGRLEPSEISLLCELATRLGRQWSRQDIEDLGKEDPRATIDSVTTLPMTPQARRSLFREAYMVSMADGHMDEQEEVLLEYLRNALGLSVRFAEIMAMWCETFLQLQQTGVLLIEEGEDAVVVDEE